jgi:hypothetical protein
LVATELPNEQHCPTLNHLLLSLFGLASKRAVLTVFGIFFKPSRPDFPVNELVTL